MKFYYAVHHNAVRHYNILREKIDQPRYTCRSPHDTALQLEVQDVTKVVDFEHSEKYGGEGGVGLRFRALREIGIIREYGDLARHGL